MNERKQFLSSQEINNFFNEITKSPNIPHGFSSKNYTISINYSPNAQGSYRTSGGLVQEAPTVIQEHAVYRLLKGKAKQHAVIGPRIVCIGSDQSPALSRMNGPNQVRMEDAIHTAFSEHRSLSAALIVRIENIPIVFEGFVKQARAELFTNHYAKTPLLPGEIQLISKLNFNNWKYSYPLSNWKNQGGDQFNSVTGTLTWRPRPFSMQVEIPANIIVDALAGKTTIDKVFGLKKDEKLYQIFNEGWNVESCSFKKGNLEQGEAPKVILELSPPLRVFEGENKIA